MAATRTRVTCPHCGRQVALVPVTHTYGLAYHGPRRSPCPGSRLTHIEGPLTERQIAFFQHCWKVGDALPVARMLKVTYPQPNIPVTIRDDIDRVVGFLQHAARQWIGNVVNEHQQAQGVPA